MRAKLKEVKDQLRQRRHEPVPEQGRWLGSVVRGHMAYYAVPGNIRAVRAFRTQVTRHWRAALGSRSQRGYLNWNRMNRLATRWLPQPRILHPTPTNASSFAPEAGAQCVSSARWDLRGGAARKGGPYRDRR
jgi:RNA-directed DNA polymerase